MKKLIIALTLIGGGAFAGTLTNSTAGVQSILTGTDSVNLWDYTTVIDGVVDGTYSNIPATTADILFYVDSTTSNIQATTVNGMFNEARVIASVEASGSVTSSVTPTAMAVFTTNDFFSSTPAIFHTSGDTGLTTLIPSRFRVTFIGSIKGSNGNEFIFQFYADGVPCGPEIGATSIGTLKHSPFSVSCITQALGVGDLVELRVWDSGNIITEITGIMIIEFAGL